MKTNLKISLVTGLLLAAGLAYSQAPMGRGDCAMMGGMEGGGMKQGRMGNMDPAKMQAMIDKHHAAMKAKLKITADQEGAWSAFTAAHQPPAGMMEKRQAMMDEMSKLTIPQRIDKMQELRAQRMGEMTAAMDKRAAATKALYAALSPEQQKIFDAMPMMGAGGARTPQHMHGGKGPMSPKQ